MFSFVDELLNLVFPLPRECPLCRAPGPPEVCAACRAVLEVQRQAGCCLRCGRFSPALPGIYATVPAAGTTVKTGVNPGANTPAGGTGRDLRGAWGVPPGGPGDETRGTRGEPAGEPGVRGAPAVGPGDETRGTRGVPAGGPGDETRGAAPGALPRGPSAPVNGLFAETRHTPALSAGRQFLCPECARLNRPFALVRAAGLYDGPLKEAVHRFKYAGRRSLAVPLAGLLIDILAGPEFASAGFPRTAPEGLPPAGATPSPGWVIVPAPLSPGRMRERGYNQAGLLARQLARRLDLPLVERALLKRRETAPQVGLSHRDREKNLAGAFAAGQNTAFLGKNTLLIDDVFTTGSTISAAAEVLLLAGAGKVYGLVLAAGRFI